MKYYKTKKCIVCLKKATVFAGHLIGIPPQRRLIFAGFCKKHSLLENSYHNFMNKQGCFGGWHPRYGIQDDET